MGYCYDLSGKLACDSCGDVGGVRKRKCPHKVHYPAEVNGGRPGSLPYCYPAALCGPCYKKHGGAKGVHAGCKEGAAASSAKYAEKAAKLAAGELEIRTGWGDWHADVPSGFVGVLFLGAGGATKAYRLVPEGDYLKLGEYLSDYPHASPWDGPSDGAVTKQIASI